MSARNGSLLSEMAAAPAGAGLSAVARRRGMTIDELARWAVEDAEGVTALDALAALRRLEDARAALVVSRMRVRAATALLRLAQEADSEETRRKACADLLTLEPPTHGDERGEEAEAPAVDEATEALLREALERRGAEVGNA